MLKIISTCWPWDHGYLSADHVLTHLEALGADEVCIRDPVYYGHYDDPDDPTFHDRLVSGARSRGMGVSLWVPVSLVYPHDQARAIQVEYDRYEPDRVILDAERRWVNNYGPNTRRFLEALGVMPCPVGLSSYRRPSLHTEVRWQTWLTTKVDGQYVIDFQASQLYPLGWMSAAGWVYQYRLDIDDNERQHRLAGRPDIPWLPFVPAFTEGVDPYGNPWYPRVDGLSAAMDYMATRLGPRLLGLNWWSLDQNMAVDPRLRPVYDYVAGAIPPPVAYQATVKASVLNVRAGPGIEFAKVRQVKYGALVTIFESTVSGWGRIGEGEWVSLAWVTRT